MEAPIMSTYWGPFTQAPNLLILMTDQQRTAQHLPAGWVQQNLPNLWAIMQGGVSFPNAMTNTTACSPARATLWTSTFPMLNGVDSVGMTLNMKDCLTTLGLALARYAPPGVTYNIAYKGKWHLDGSFESGVSLAQQQEQPYLGHQLSDNQAMASVYGFPGWTSQDFGTTMAPELSNWRGGPITVSTGAVNTLGAGGGGNDERVATGVSYVPGGTVEGALQWLAAQKDNAADNPFCLVVSLLNPHDVFVSPAGYDSAGFPPLSSGPNAGQYPWRVAPFTDITALPESYVLPPDVLSNKPCMQTGFRWTAAAGAEEEAQRAAAALDYFRFYAYLETLTDALLGQVMAQMTDEMTENTLIVRLADHGEMAMAQGGMIEKEHQAYNESLLVPLVFANPGLPQGVACTGLAGLIDVLPTLAEICGLSLPSSLTVQGCSLAPAILAGATGSTYPQLLFASNDAQVEIRALVDDCAHNAKYVVSSNGPGWQCELYDFSYDPGAADPWPSEIVNQVPVDGLHSGAVASTPALQATWNAMHVALTNAMAATDTTPAGWPAAPPATVPA
jgi:arylsulfatase A-like enzyme